MLRALYTLCLHLALPFLPLRLWWRGRREPGYRRDIGQRFGRYGAPPDRPVIWIHAVSLGETRAAQPLVAALRARYPGHALLVTHMTATGREAAASLYGDFATLAFLPYDFPWAVRRFVAHFRPVLGVLMETEVWPNLVRECRGRGVPLLLANARLEFAQCATHRRERLRHQRLGKSRERVRGEGQVSPAAVRGLSRYCPICCRIPLSRPARAASHGLPTRRSACASPVGTFARHNRRPWTCSPRKYAQWRLT